jgi:hypothetical protein
MLADTLEGYKQRERSLVSDFEKVFPEIYHGMVEDATHDNLVQWVERFSPRRYGLIKCICCILILGTRFVQYAKSLKLLRKLIKIFFGAIKFPEAPNFYALQYKGCLLMACLVIL